MHLICNCQEALVVPFDPSPFTPEATEHRRIPGQMISEWQRRRGQIQAACLLASNWEKASRSAGYRCKCQQKSVLLLKFIIDFFVWIAWASVPSHCFCKRSLCPENGWYDQRFCKSISLEIIGQILIVSRETYWIKIFRIPLGYKKVRRILRVSVPAQISSI